MYRNDHKIFCRNISKTNIYVLVIYPSRGEVTKFRGSIWTYPKKHNNETVCSNQQFRETEHIIEQVLVSITIEYLRTALGKSNK